MESGSNFLALFSHLKVGMTVCLLRLCEDWMGRSSQEYENNGWHKIVSYYYYYHFRKGKRGPMATFFGFILSLEGDNIQSENLFPILHLHT